MWLRGRGTRARRAYASAGVLCSARTTPDWPNISSKIPPVWRLVSNLMLMSVCVVRSQQLDLDDPLSLWGDPCVLSIGTLGSSSDLAGQLEVDELEAAQAQHSALVSQMQALLLPEATTSAEPNAPVPEASIVDNETAPGNTDERDETHTGGISGSCAGSCACGPEASARSRARLRATERDWPPSAS